jgi:hypothetical protein
MTNKPRDTSEIRLPHLQALRCHPRENEKENEIGLGLLIGKFVASAMDVTASVHVTALFTNAE